MSAVPIVMDIETVADDAWLAESEEAWLAALAPPANYKKAESIHGWIATKVAERRERAPLSPVEGKVAAVAFAPLWSDDDLPEAFAGDDEAELLARLSAWMRLAGRPLVCGYEVRRFDLPFLAARYAAHGLEADWIPDPHDRRMVIDAADVLQSAATLDLWLRRFKLPPKTASGAQVATMTHEERRAYCANDVRVERLLLRRLAGVFPSLRTTRPQEANTP